MMYSKNFRMAKAGLNNPMHTNVKNDKEADRKLTDPQEREKSTNWKQTGKGEWFFLESGLSNWIREDRL